MGELVPTDQMQRYVPSEIVADSAPVGRADFRLRTFRAAPFECRLPPFEDHTFVVYRRDAGHIARHDESTWNQVQVRRGLTTFLKRGHVTRWSWSHEIECTHHYISDAFIMRTADQIFDCDAASVAVTEHAFLDDPLLSWLSEQMVQEVDADRPGARLIFEALSLQATVHLLRHYSTVKLRKPSAQGHLRVAHQRLINDFLDQNMDRTVTLADLARVCDCTPTQFSRKFKEYFGLRIQEYVLKKRVELACRYIEDDRHPMKEIALLSGFADQSHLNRAFRRFMDITPTEYRKRKVSTVTFSLALPIGRSSD